MLAQVLAQVLPALAKVLAPVLAQALLALGLMQVLRFCRGIAFAA